MSALRAKVEDFLYADAELLDAWSLNEWFANFTPDCTYLVPSTDRPEGDPITDLFFVRDDHFLLSQRVEALLNGKAWAESPRSTTHRMLSNVRVKQNEDGSIEAKANLIVHRSSNGQLDLYPAFLTLDLIRGGTAGFLIRRRVAVLAMEQLRPHGRLSILL